MVYFVCLANGPNVKVVLPPQVRKSLVDDYIMNDEVTKAIEENANSNRNQEIHTIHGAKHYQ